MPSCRVSWGRVTEGRRIKNKRTTVWPEVETIEIRHPPIRTCQASIELESLDEWVILPVHSKLRVNGIEGVIWRVRRLDSFPEASLDHDVVFTLSARPDIEEIRIDGAHGFPRPFITRHHRADRLSSAERIVSTDPANGDSWLSEIDLQNIHVPGPGIHDYPSVYYSSSYDVHDRRVELLGRDL